MACSNRRRSPRGSTRTQQTLSGMPALPVHISLPANASLSDPIVHTVQVEHLHCVQCGPAWTPLALKVWRGLHPLKLALVQKCTGNSSTGTLNIGSWPKLNTPLKPQCTLRHQAIRSRPPGAKKIVVVVHFGDQRFACGAPSSPATCLPMPSHARNGALPPPATPTAPH